MSQQVSTPARSKRWRGNVLAAVLIVVAMLAVYYPAIQSNYGATDDFPTFFPVDDHIPQIYRADGRPILELLLVAIDPPVNNLACLQILRGISIVGIGLLGFALFFAARPVIEDRIVRICLAIAAGCLPTLTVFAAWATVWSYAWGAALAIVAGGLSWLAVRSYTARRSWQALLWVLVSCLAVVLIFGTYQPLVSWIWVVGIGLLLDRRVISFRLARRQVAAWMAIGITQMALCFVALKSYFLLTSIEPKSRAQLLSEPLEKIAAIVRHTLPMALAQWQVIDANRKAWMIAIAAATPLVVVIGLVCFALRNQKQKRQTSFQAYLLWGSGLVICLALCHVHGLAINANVKNYRTMGALAVAVTLLLFWAIRNLSDIMASGEWKRFMCRALALLVAVSAAVVARQNLTHYWTQPYSQGYDFLVAELKNGLTPETRRIHLIRQSVDDGMVTEKAIHSFGRPLTEPEWVMPGLVIAALHDIAPNRDWKALEITHSLTPPNKEPDMVMIDMRKLKELHRRKKP